MIGTRGRPAPGDVVEYLVDLKAKESDSTAWHLRTVRFVDERVLYFQEGGCAAIFNPMGNLWRWPSTYEPPVATPIGNLHDLLASTCAGDHAEEEDDPVFPPRR